MMSVLQIECIGMQRTNLGPASTFFFFFFLQERAAVPRRQANCLQSPTVLQLREHEGSRAQRQAAGACRGCELQRALEWRSVALVWMQWGGPGPS